MIPNTKLINALRALGYTFKRQADRVCIYKMQGSTKRVAVRRHNSHDEEYARIILAQAGLPSETIEKFIAECREQTSKPRVAISSPPTDGSSSASQSH